MGIALFTSNSLFGPLQAALGWLSGALPARPLPAPAGALRACAPGVRGILRRPHDPGAPAVRRLSAGPVRVLCVVDAQAPTVAGRLRISGRMADVCAELDRLAALEPGAGRARRHHGAAPRA